MDCCCCSAGVLSVGSMQDSKWTLRIWRLEFPKECSRSSGTKLTLTYHRVCDFRCLVRRRSQLRSARAGERSAWHCAASALVRSASEWRSSPPTHPRTSISTDLHLLHRNTVVIYDITHCDSFTLLRQFLLQRCLTKRYCYRTLWVYQFKPISTNRLCN